MQVGWSMKFNNFDELINFLHGKDLSKLEFNILGLDEECNSCDVSDDSSLKVSFSGFSDSPEEEFKIAKESYLLVDDFKHIPNACAASTVSVFGKELFLTICENEQGKPTVKMDVEVGGAKIVGKEFILTTDPSIGNQIDISK